MAEFGPKLSAAYWSGRERLVVKVARSYLPRGLRWLVRTPRLLAIVYKLRSSWRPTIYVGVDPGACAFCARSKDGTLHVLEVSTASPTDWVQVDDIRKAMCR